MHIYKQKCSSANWGHSAHRVIKLSFIAYSHWEYNRPDRIDHCVTVTPCLWEMDPPEHEDWRITFKKWQRIMPRHVVCECYCVLHLFGFNYFMSVRRHGAPVGGPYQVYYDDDDDWWWWWCRHNVCNEAAWCLSLQTWGWRTTISKSSIVLILWHISKKMLKTNWNHSADCVEVWSVDRACFQAEEGTHFGGKVEEIADHWTTPSTVVLEKKFQLEISLSMSSVWHFLNVTMSRKQ